MYTYYKNLEKKTIFEFNKISQLLQKLTEEISQIDIPSKNKYFLSLMIEEIAQDLQLIQEKKKIMLLNLPYIKIKIYWQYHKYHNKNKKCYFIEINK